MANSRSKEHIAKTVRSIFQTCHSLSQEHLRDELRETKTDFNKRGVLQSGVYAQKIGSLVDQAANFRKGTDIRLSTKGPFNEDAITAFNSKTITNLENLDSYKLLKLKPFISDEEILRILHHRDGILHFYNSH